MPTFWDSSIRFDLLMSETIGDLKMADRLSDKWTKAGGVVQRIEGRIEERLDKLIAREAAMEHKTDQVFDRHEAPLDDSEKALDALDRKLDLLSNGGPAGPLDGSGSSPAVGPVASTFQAAVDTKTTG